MGPARHRTISLPGRHGAHRHRRVSRPIPGDRPHLAFWFRFVYPHRAETETGQSSEVLSLVREEIASYCGRIFELLCEDLVRSGILFSGSPPPRLGRWWHREAEIDLVGLDEEAKTALFCECTWSDLTTREARAVLVALQEKAAQVRWRNGERNERFALVAKQIQGKDALTREGYLVRDLEDIAESSRRFLARRGG